MIEVREYVDAAGRSAFKVWFDDLDRPAAIKVTVALQRIAEGHTAALKSVGEGVSEYTIDFGPGLRIYFGKDGERLVILLAGGTKQRQQRDVANAQAAWKEYKRRKKQGA